MAPSNYVPFYESEETSLFFCRINRGDHRTGAKRAYLTLSSLTGGVIRFPTLLLIL